jgi:hypothetical protein
MLSPLLAIVLSTLTFSSTESRPFLNVRSSNWSVATKRESERANKCTISRNAWKQLENNEITDFFPFDDTTYNNGDCDNDDDIPFSFNANIQEDIIIPSLPSSSSSSYSSDRHIDSSSSLLKKPSLHKVVQNVMNKCYQTCPGNFYTSLSSTSTLASTVASSPSSVIVTCPENTSCNRRGESNYDNSKMKKMKFASLLRRKKQKDQSTTSTLPPPSTTTTTTATEEEEETIQEPSPAILSGIIKPLIPTSIWNSLTGNEFFYPSTLSNLIQTGISIACGEYDNEISWKPADSKTKKILAENEKTESDDDNLNVNKNQSIINALNDNQVIVWMGKFMSKNQNDDEGYGSNLPLIKTTSIIPLSPKAFAELLMDSSQVQSYNKMSLGRSDVVVFQNGVDTEANSEDGKSFTLDGEAKIVRNVTKPPLSKKLMDFVTLMYARKIKEEDDVSTGYLGGDASYIVISRAVGGKRWSSSNSNNPDDENDDEEKEEMIRSEILLGVNLLRSIPGEPDKTEVTAVTHVYSPSVPTMLAGTVGVKGAIDFIKDIQALVE